MQHDKIVAEHFIFQIPDCGCQLMHIYIFAKETERQHEDRVVEINGLNAVVSTFVYEGDVITVRVQWIGTNCFEVVTCCISNMDMVSMYCNAYAVKSANGSVNGA